MCASEAVIYSIEGAFGRIGAMVVHPAPDARVEGGDEGGLVTPAMGADEGFHLFQVALLRCAAGFEDHFVALFAVDSARAASRPCRAMAGVDGIPLAQYH